MARSTGFDRWVASLRHAAALAHLRPGARVCDVGCGVDALFLETLAGRAQRLVGVDYQRVTTRHAGVAFVQADLERFLPLVDASFDHVTMLAVIEHLPRPEAALAEAFRILAPGGSLILTWPSALVDPMLAVLFRLGIVSPEMESSHHQPRRKVKAWVGLLASMGFEDIRHRTFELGLNHLMVARKPM